MAEFFPIDGRRVWVGEPAVTLTVFFGVLGLGMELLELGVTLRGVVRPDSCSSLELLVFLAASLPRGEGKIGWF